MVDISLALRCIIVLILLSAARNREFLDCNIWPPYKFFRGFRTNFCFHWTQVLLSAIAIAIAVTITIYYCYSIWTVDCFGNSFFNSVLKNGLRSGYLRLWWLKCKCQYRYNIGLVQEDFFYNFQVHIGRLLLSLDLHQLVE